jgi:hypothetical protein
MSRKHQTSIPETPTASCASCNTPLQGNFCHKCGEKQVHPQHDFSIKEFIEQTVDGFTHFDLKFIKTFKYLLFQPGRLTKDYLEGRRVNLMRPVQIFIIASVLFYFFIPKSDSFYSSYDQLTAGIQNKGLSLDNPVKYNINNHLKRKALKDTGNKPGVDSLNKLASKIYVQAATKMTGKSKSFLFLILPFWGMGIFLLFYRKNRFYVPHLVFALHAFCFFLLADMAFLVFYFDLLGLHSVHNTTHLLPFFILLLVYIILSVRKVYTQKWFSAIWKGLTVYLLLLFLLLLYRVFITWWAVYSV